MLSFILNFLKSNLIFHFFMYIAVLSEIRKYDGHIISLFSILLSLLFVLIDHFILYRSKKLFLNEKENLIIFLYPYLFFVLSFLGLKIATIAGFHNGKSLVLYTIYFNLALLVVRFMYIEFLRHKKNISIQIQDFFIAAVLAISIISIIITYIYLKHFL